MRLKDYLYLNLHNGIFIATALVNSIISIAVKASQFFLRKLFVKIVEITTEDINPVFPN